MLVKKGCYIRLKKTSAVWLVFQKCAAAPKQLVLHFKRCLTAFLSPHFSWHASMQLFKHQTIMCFLLANGMALGMSAEAHRMNFPHSPSWGWHTWLWMKCFDNWLPHIHVSLRMNTTATTAWLYPVCFLQIIFTKTKSSTKNTTPVGFNKQTKKREINSVCYKVQCLKSVQGKPSFQTTQ